MPYPDMAAAVQNGNVDAIWQVEPFQAVSEQAGLVKIGNLFDGPAADMPVAGWITTRDYAEANPEVIDDHGPGRAAGRPPELWGK